jgi:RNA polymerase sigma-54 factor
MSYGGVNTKEVNMKKIDTSLRQHLGIEQRLSQRLMMSPQMQQAMQCLQLPVLELSQIITQEMEQNPLLEFDEENLINLPIYRAHNKKRGALAEELLAYQPTLRDVLLEQLFERCENAQDREWGAFIIDSLNDSGVLNADIHELAIHSGASPAKIAELLTLIQSMEPAGVGATSVQESFLIQLERQNKKQTLAYTILKDYYDDFLKNRILKIVKGTGASEAELSQAIKKDIATLELHPGLNFSTHQAREIVPDVIVRSNEEGLSVEVTDFYSDKLHLNRAYMELFEDPDVPSETKNYIKEKLQSIQWLMKNIGQRNTTLRRIAEELIKINPDYFSYPDGRLTPLTMRHLAEALELHESTIARAVSNKFLFCDRGIVPLKSFFTKGYRTDRGEHISSKTIQDKIKKLIGEESDSSPLSDQELSLLLKQQGITCARRTVAKYREAMGIGSTKYR